MVPTDLPTQESEPTQSADEAPTTAPQSGVAHSSKERNPTPTISEAELQALSAGNQPQVGDCGQACVR